MGDQRYVGAAFDHNDLLRVGAVSHECVGGRRNANVSIPKLITMPP
jgi:hypothetical protein